MSDNTEGMHLKKEAASLHTDAAKIAKPAPAAMQLIWCETGSREQCRRFTLQSSPAYSNAHIHSEVKCDCLIFLDRSVVDGESEWAEVIVKVLNMIHQNRPDVCALSAGI